MVSSQNLIPSYSTILVCSICLMVGMGQLGAVYRLLLLGVGLKSCFGLQGEQSKCQGIDDKGTVLGCDGQQFN
ncbi:unnamed protein product [Paramecium octaurelia]|uniref:Uncharacterized protein n=1 Tax=Paramecium octaurelia TaxID=43137 RepID=A0A8S1WHX0_PAROT|nr:unnamed protein product [Paramecium octaurelia]